jgi:hypothetical protein
MQPTQPGEGGCQVPAAETETVAKA